MGLLPAIPNTICMGAGPSPTKPRGLSHTEGTEGTYSREKYGRARSFKYFVKYPFGDLLMAVSYI